MATTVDPPSHGAWWAASGAMALTGRPNGPALGPPVGFVGKLAGIAGRVGLDADEALALLSERAALSGFTRGGTTSCGGATRLLATADGWIALSLARADDVELLPAWLGPVDAAAELCDGDHNSDGDGDSDADQVARPWTAVAEIVRSRTGSELLDAADGLGLPLSALPAGGPAVPAVRPSADLPVGWTGVEGPSVPARSLVGVRVVDLTSLWAGPLCASLLADAGADVVKVESTGRPDGARGGSPAFFDLLHAGKRSVALDLASPEGRLTLARLLSAADVVLEGSRPRALRSMGIVAEDVVADGPAVWVSITGHGRTGAAGQRVGFGDDAAIAGGLVAWEDGEPRFCADAVADPLSGLVAAAAVVEAVDRGGRWLVDVGLAAVSRYLAGPTAPVESVVQPPQARRRRGEAPRLGADTDAVLGALR